MAFFSASIGAISARCGVFRHAARLRVAAAGGALAVLSSACAPEEAAAPPEPEEAAPPPADADGFAAGEEVAPREAESAPSYMGVWAADAGSCAGTPGAAEPAPIAFAEDEFIGFETRCRIAHADAGEKADAGAEGDRGEESGDEIQSAPQLAGGTPSGEGLRWRLELVCPRDRGEHTEYVTEYMDVALEIGAGGTDALTVTRDGAAPAAFVRCR